MQRDSQSSPMRDEAGNSTQYNAADEIPVYGNLNSRYRYLCIRLGVSNATHVAVVHLREWSSVSKSRLLGRLVWQHVHLSALFASNHSYISIDHGRVGLRVVLDTRWLIMHQALYHPRHFLGYEVFGSANDGWVGLGADGKLLGLGKLRLTCLHLVCQQELYMADKVNLVVVRMLCVPVPK